MFAEGKTMACTPVSGLFSQCTIFSFCGIGLVFGFLLKDAQLPTALAQPVWCMRQQSPEIA